MKMNEHEGSYAFWDRVNVYLETVKDELTEALESSDISSSSKIRWFVLRDLIDNIVNEKEENEYYREINKIL
jgi:hypothetical protein